MSKENPPNSDDDTESDGISNHYDWSSTAPSTAIVETIAQAMNCESLEVGPLYEWVDPDSLDAIFDGHSTRTRNSATSISFSYTNYTVTVNSTGTVHVAPA
ncbi:hypothetical protein A4G99_19030 [Haladaptatus sp. R4]|uniref:HalOD1 output domain-containing protein n=1 Tax=Haladaptatus sp. R4 TaxID=1679489 RepID=UPI0007B4C96C|nr:HalOD1 output domain-containing protein [Haladaptatus sp. R4]KZN22563.1 hypothetical protein A4G99_19030 [Haladaptatus sp. R4]